MEWYEKLSDYFPDAEMKHAGQMVDLLNENVHYEKIETEHYIVTYAEFRSFIFIDYLLVTSHERGKGVGSKLIDHFKNLGKTIVLEVEPENEEEPNTVQRVRFYVRNGFKKAEHIIYTRADDDGQEFSMDVYYWSPDVVSEKDVMHYMSTICREIHNFNALKYYGRLLADPKTSLEWSAH